MQAGAVYLLLRCVAGACMHACASVRRQAVRSLWTFSTRVQAADTAAIRTAITEEARSRGIEHTLKEERPPVARRGLRLPAGLFGELGEGNEQIIQLLQQALEGQLPAGLQLNISGGGQAGEGAEAGEQEQVGERHTGAACLF